MNNCKIKSQNKVTELTQYKQEENKIKTHKSSGEGKLVKMHLTSHKRKKVIISESYLCLE